MKKMIFLFFCLITFKNVYAAPYEIVMDADSGRVLYSRNKDVKHYIASTTKIMSTLVVLNSCNLNDTVEIGEEVLDAYGSSIYIKPKEKMRVEDLLYGLMLRSGNDAALALAVHTAGTVEEFVKLMNKYAKEIKMYNTHFGNPHGLDDTPSNQSTVYDMALLMQEAMKNDTFRKITSTKKYITKSNFNTYEWHNKNELLKNYEYATGGKIGYTSLAKHTFVSSASKNGMNLIIASFEDKDRFNNHEKLYEKFFNDYKKYILIDKNKLNIDYKKGYKLFTLESFSMMLKDSELDSVNREITLYENVTIGKDATVIGNISISINGTVYKKLNIYGEKQAHKNNFIEWLRGLFSW